MKRKITIILIAFVLLFSLFGCKNDNLNIIDDTEAIIASSSTEDVLPTTSTIILEKETFIFNKILLDENGKQEKTYYKSESYEKNNIIKIEYPAIDGYEYCGYTSDEIIAIDGDVMADSSHVINLYYTLAKTYAIFLCDNDGKIINIEINKKNIRDTSKLTIKNTEESRYNNGFEKKYTVNKGIVYINKYKVSEMSEFLMVFNGTVTGTLVKGNTIIVNTSLDGFTCWRLNGNIYSYKKSMVITFDGAMVLTACTDEISPRPLISVNEIDNKLIAHVEPYDEKLVDAGAYIDGIKESKALNATNDFILDNECDCYIITSKNGNISTHYIKEKSTAISGNAYVVSPNGSSANEGALNSPLSLISGLNALEAGDTLYLLPGTYNVNSKIVLDKSGTKDNYTRLIALGDVIFDYGKYYSKDNEIDNGSSKSSNVGILISGDYYHLYGITVYRAGSTGIRISGNNNIVERCIARENGNTGIHIAGNGSDFDLWPHDNYILNCTSFGNYDWNDEEAPGEDADGFACKIRTGNNNVFDGCIAYCNSDDGWDLYCYQDPGAIGSVTIINSIAFKNGYYFDGTELNNGNGFKLGGMAVAVDHYVSNCIAFENKAHGFDDNSNPGTLYLTNCTGYNNKGNNFQTGRWVEDSSYTYGNGERGTFPVSKSHNVLKNCISYYSDKINNDTYVGTAENCILSRENKYYKIDELIECNHKTNKGEVYNMTMPFLSIEVDLSDLYNIDKLFRDKYGYISLNNFMKLIDNYSSYGAALSIGKTTYLAK